MLELPNSILYKPNITHMKSLIFSFILLFSFTIFPASAQFGGLGDRIAKRTKDKLERKAEDKLVERLSEELARMAFKPIDKAMDDMLRSSYEEKEGGEVDWEKAGSAYGDFLNGMNEAANIQESYTFDLQMEVEIKDGEKEKHNMTLLFNKGRKIMAFEQKKENSTIIFDNENDVMIMLTDKDGKKEGQAVPSMMKLAGAFAVGAEMDKQAPMEFKPNGKTKKIAGYNTTGYDFESEKEKGTTYIAKDFPVNIVSAFGNSYENFLPANYTETVNMMDGMAFESTYQSKVGKKPKGSFKTKKVSEKTITYKSSEWGLNPKS